MLWVRTCGEQAASPSDSQGAHDEAAFFIHRSGIAHTHARWPPEPLQLLGG
jgi:hypothetical protein